MYTFKKTIAPDYETFWSKNLGDIWNLELYDGFTKL